MTQVQISYRPTLRRRLLAIASLPALALLAAGCHKKQRIVYQPPPPIYPSRSAGRYPTRREPESSRIPPESSIPLGRPIETQVGLASWYGPPYTNRHAADGSIYDQNAMTAAHRTLPMGSIVRVTNVATGQSAVVRITDRGPFIDGRIIDLSLAAAKATGIYRAGVAKVRIEAYAPQGAAEPAGRWCVQIGAFSDESDAIQLKNDLHRRYSHARVIEFAGPTGHWVRINPDNPDKATATQIADSIHIPDPSAQPYLVRLN